MSKRRVFAAAVAGACGLALAVPAAHALDVCIPRCGVLGAGTGSSIEPNPNDLRASAWASVSVLDGTVSVSKSASVSSAAIVDAVPVPSITHDGPSPLSVVVGLVSGDVVTAQKTAATVTNKLPHV